MIQAIGIKAGIEVESPGSVSQSLSPKLGRSGLCGLIFKPVDADDS
jgi:hypothetical protein